MGVSCVNMYMSIYGISLCGIYIHVSVYGLSVCGYAHLSVGACGGQRCQTLCTEGTGDCKPHSVGAGN